VSTKKLGIIVMILAWYGGIMLSASWLAG